MPFDAQALRSRLNDKRIGGLLRYHETADSTNRLAAELAREGAPEGTVVLADRQTAGRGRLQRIWQSPPGCNLYLSLILRPAVDPSDLAQITLLTGVAVADAIAAVCPDGVGIKWPNDILIRGRKVCGILTEMRTFEGRRVLIVGIGLNVNIRRNDFDPDHRDTATSLREETGRDHSREDLVFSLCERFERWYETYLREGFSPIREGWLTRSRMAGKPVRILFGKEILEGTMAGIDRDGALLLGDERGEVRRILAGDATILKR